MAPHAPGLPTAETRAGVHLRRFRYAPEALERVAYRGDLHATSAASILALVGIPAFLVGFARALRRAARQLMPDVVHAHWWMPGAWVAAGLDAPLVVTCHGSDVRMLGRSGLLRRVAARVLARARVITTVSDFLGAALAQALPMLRTPVRTLSMPLDVARFATGTATPRAEPPRILYAGNLLESKGIDDLLAAVAILRARGVACRLKILGEGPSLAALRERATALGIADLVDWSSFVGQDAMPQEYGAASVTVLPTRDDAEGLGLTLAEASLAGSAVVGTRAGGIPEFVVDEDTGLIARDRDPADLARQLERLLVDAALRERLQARAASVARRRFAPETAVAAFLAIYADAAQH